MELLRMLELLRRRLRTIALLCVSAPIAAFLLTYTFSQSFEAAAIVMVKPTEAIKISAQRPEKELLEFPVTSSGGLNAVELPMNTYIEILRSRAVAERIVRELDLAVEPEPETGLRDRLLGFVRSARDFVRYGHSVPPQTAFDEAVERIQEDLSLSAIEKSQLFEVRFTAKDPEIAAAVANTSTTVLLEHLREVNEPEQESSLVFMKEKVASAEASLADARDALRAFKEEQGIVAFAEEVAEEIKLAARLQAELDLKSAELQGLEASLTPQNPKVVSARAERDRLRETLAPHVERPQSLPRQERELRMLELQVDDAVAVYQLLHTEYEATRIRNARSNFEMRLASPAVAPKYPSRVGRAKYAVAAFVLGLVLGIAWALLDEYLDTTLRRVEDVERVLGLRVLATLPSDPPS